MADRPDEPKVEKVGVVEYEHVGTTYFEERSLERRAGVILVWGLGVGYVISGEYFSWNFGLANGGWGGMLLATLLAITMYSCMVYSISEMAPAFPVPGAPTPSRGGPWGCGAGSRRASEPSSNTSSLRRRFA